MLKIEEKLNNTLELMNQCGIDCTNEFINGNDAKNIKSIMTSIKEYSEEKYKTYFSFELLIAMKLYSDYIFNKLKTDPNNIEKLIIVENILSNNYKNSDFYMEDIYAQIIYKAVAKSNNPITSSNISNKINRLLHTNLSWKDVESVINNKLIEKIDIIQSKKGEKSKLMIKQKNEQIDDFNKEELRLNFYDLVIIVKNRIDICLCNNQLEYKSINIPFYNTYKKDEVSRSFIGGVCKKCKSIYVEETELESSQNMSLIIIPVDLLMDDICYLNNKFLVKPEILVKSEQFEKESFLKKRGYNVDKKIGTSEDIRRLILKKCLLIYSKKRVVGHIKWLIKRNKNNSIMQDAIKLWQDDLKWLIDYLETNGLAKVYYN